MKTEMTTTSDKPVNIAYYQTAELLVAVNSDGYIRYTRAEAILLRDFLNQLDLEERKGLKSQQHATFGSQK